MACCGKRIFFIYSSEISYGALVYSSFPSPPPVPPDDTTSGKKNYGQQVTVASSGAAQVCVWPSTDGTDIRNHPMALSLEGSSWAGSDVSSSFSA